jgi:hypothetical protein
MVAMPSVTAVASARNFLRIEVSPSAAPRPLMAANALDIKMVAKASQQYDQMTRL